MEEHLVRLKPGEKFGGSGPLLNAGFPEDHVNPLADPTSSRAQREPVDCVSVERDGKYEIILYGKGHSAWGHFLLKGRVRPWDGLFSLVKEYVGQGRGRWLYRGYVTAGKPTLVGRWRDTFTTAEVAGYEGSFVMSRRSD